MTSPTSHDAQRVSREAEIYDNDELERDRLRGHVTDGMAVQLGIGIASTAMLTGKFFRLRVRLGINDKINIALFVKPSLL